MQEGWIEAEWGTSGNDRRTKYYRLTEVGEKDLAAELASWERYTGAVRLVLQRG